jgi:putative acetyltransferase
MRIELDDVTRPEVLALLDEHLQNMHVITPPEGVFAFDAARLRSPDVTLWTAWDEGTLLGCAALKELSPTQGEIKSMRTKAERRRSGVGRALLDHIIAVARDRRYNELFLETGRQPAFAPAHALYRSAGFRDCGSFGQYEDTGTSVFMRMKITAASQ